MNRNKRDADVEKEEVVITHSKWTPDHPRLPEGISVISFGLMPPPEAEVEPEEDEDSSG